MENRHIPVPMTILSGFPGTGKTTLWLAPISRPRNGKNKVHPDGCCRLQSEHEVLFARVVQTVHRFHAARRKPGVQESVLRGLSPDSRELPKGGVYSSADSALCLR